MKKTTLIILIALINLLFVESITAKIKLPAIVSSNMVLQRNTTITIWGWADANEKISIKASWLDKDINIKADENGDWKVKAKTTNSKAIQSINIKSKTSNINLENILFGEVWLCSGQSNMEQPLNGFRAQPTFGGNMFTLKSKNPNLRIFTVKKVKSKTPTKDLLEYIPWQEASPNTVHSFSAIAYFFGEQLQRTLDVPVGLIHSSWGGSRIESWMSIDVLSKYKKVDISKNSRDTSTAMFNSMINPLMNFKIKGVLWYQGESNRFNPELYKKLFPAMVEDWRAKWNIGNFPFYYVQIAPYI